MSDVVVLSKVTVVARNGSERVIQADPHMTVMEALREGGFDELLALCGGACSCATCHVYVDSSIDAIMRPASQDEDDLLDSSNHRRANSRLSCQIKTSDVSGERVTIAPDD